MVEVEEMLDMLP